MGRMFDEATPWMMLPAPGSSPDKNRQAGVRSMCVTFAPRVLKFEAGSGSFQEPQRRPAEPLPFAVSLLSSATLPLLPQGYDVIRHTRLRGSLPDERRLVALNSRHRVYRHGTTRVSGLARALALLTSVYTSRQWRRRMPLPSLALRRRRALSR